MYTRATKEMIEVMKAFDEGKEIEYKRRDGETWCSNPNPYWDWSTYDYRVKPKPKYRPYKDTDEMIADWKERFGAKDWPSHSMPLIWVKTKFGGVKCFITGFTKISVRSDGTSCDLKNFFTNHTYLDGSPCGKEETEEENVW